MPPSTITSRFGLWGGGWKISKGLQSRGEIRKKIAGKAKYSLSLSNGFCAGLVQVALKISLGEGEKKPHFLPLKKKKPLSQTVKRSSVLVEE